MTGQEMAKMLGALERIAEALENISSVLDQKHEVRVELDQDPDGMVERLVSALEKK